jgi:hypothetical protein
MPPNCSIRKTDAQQPDIGVELETREKMIRKQAEEPQEEEKKK